MHQHTGQIIRGYSRRKVLGGLASILLTLSIEGCAQSLPSSSTAVPTPTHRSPGSILATYRRHTNRVTTVAWSPNGTYIASGSLDQTVQIWAANSTTHYTQTIYRGHTAGVQAVTWSPDSKLVASGSSDKTVQVWNALTGEHVATYSGHSDIVLTVAWSPDGKSIASGSADGTIRLWDVTTSMQKYVYRGHTASANSITWSPDSKHIASASADKTVQIINATTGKRLYVYRGHSNIVSSVSWSPEGKFIASGSWDKTLQVWEATTGKRLYTYKGYNVDAAKYNSDTGVLPDLILAVAWSSNGKRIAVVTQVYCGDSCGVVATWDAYTEHHFFFYIDDPVFALAWSPDNTRFVTSIEVSTQGSNMKATDGAYVQISQA